MAKKWKTRRKGRFTAKKLFLVLLVIVCLVAAAYTGYLLYTDQTNPIVGGVILLVDIGVLIWNISVLRRYRVGFGSICAVFLVTALIASTVGAFAGVAPLAHAKDRVISLLRDIDLGDLGKQRAEIKIWYIKPRSSEGYLIPKSNEVVQFGIELKPLNVTPDVKYNLVLLSHDGHLYDLIPISWNEDDFAGPESGERDINKIREAENRSTRLVSLCAKSVDKDIEPLWREFNTFYKECREKAARHGELQFRGWEGWNAGSYEPDESDFQRICNKYIEIKLLTDDECKEIEGAGSYLGK